MRLATGVEVPRNPRHIVAVVNFPGRDGLAHRKLAINTQNKGCLPRGPPGGMGLVGLGALGL